MAHKTYVFDRIYIDQPRVIVLESEENKDVFFGYNNFEINEGVCYINKDTTICFAAIVQDSTKQIESGFYPYSVVNNTYRKDQCLALFDLPNPYDFHQERVLAYNGFFSESDDYITYTFYYFPDIIIFNKKGEYVDRIKTKDNVPSPSVIRYKNYFVFERKKAYNSNFASFVYKDKIYVLSAQSISHLGKYLIDCYSFKSKEYLYSFYVSNAVEEENDYVNSLLMIGDTVTITTKNCKTILKLNKD
jgi:hypothetical protein